MSKKILITGGSGLIGKKLTDLLLKQHYQVVHLGRSTIKGKVPSFVWDVTKKQIDDSAFENVDTIIHLAGANVGEKRWTKKRKKELLDSRIESTALLNEVLQNKNHNVKKVISASAIGYYGFEGDSVFDEESKAGNDFLAELTKKWEDEVDKFSALGIRVVKIRIGIVLSAEGGALKEIAKPIRLGFGAPLGSGQQNISWIHIDDVCRIFLKALEDEKMQGAYNATAGWIANEELTKQVASIIEKPLWLPNVPSFVLKIVLGEMADIVLNGSKISSEKIRQIVFEFDFPDINSALNDIFIS